MTDRQIYTIGGTVQAGGGKYVTRDVDTDLLDHCLAGEFAFVLSARQMGKSSLMVGTARKLAEHGVRSVVIDLSQIGVSLSPDAWFLGVLTTIEEALDLETDVFEWWQDRSHLGHGQRFTQFLEEVVLAEVPERVVLFVDEIDTTLSLDFTDDFYTAVRYVHNARSQRPELARLSFVLIGVATPSQLISDPARTPFNIGKRVDVRYFTLDDAAILATGLDSDPGKAKGILKWVFAWTDGHPYLTQRLCYVIAAQRGGNWTKETVDQVVRDTFLGERADQDNNLRFVSDMLLVRADESLEVLSAFRDVVAGRLVSDDPKSAVISHLKLSGVVRSDGGKLRVPNRIYASVFSAAWIREQWPEHWLRSIPRAVLGTVAASFMALVFLGLAFTGWRERENQARFTQELAAINDSLIVAKAESDSLRALTEEANIELADALGDSDSLRTLEARANDQLESQIAVSEGLRLETADVNDQLRVQIDTSDQLRAQTEAANDSLRASEAEADSLRRLAEQRVDDAANARRETLVLGLATTALRQERQGDPELAALLARQAFEMARRVSGEYLDPVHDALIQSLNALDGSGGPDADADLDGGVRALAAGPGGVRVIGTESGRVLVRSGAGSVELTSHAAQVRGVAVTASGDRALSGGDDGIVRFHELATGNSLELGTHEGGAWAVAIGSNNRLAASVGADGVLALYTLESGTLIGTVQPEAAGRLTSVAFAPGGDLLVAGSDTGKLVRFPIRNEVLGEPSLMDARSTRVLSVAFSRDGGSLASGGSEGTVRIWNTGDWSERRVLQEHVGPVNAVAFSRDGVRFASGSSDHSVGIWSGGFDQNPVVLQGHDGWVMSLAFSEDGTRILSGSSDRTVRTWTVETGRLADRVCEAVGRELTAAEWAQYVGDDFDYNRELAACSTLAETNQ